MERPPAERAPEGEQRARGFDAVGHLERDVDVVGAVPHVDGHPLGHRGPALEVAVDRLGPPVVVLVRDRIEDPVVEREHVVAPRLLPPQVDELSDLLGELGSEVA